ncbi:MAG: DUF4922 domain-containing protein [Prolixibacteraceae bacterium]|nr:DUF4922 domain-containing protein [Prolixibacteraceae bacterium]
MINSKIIALEELSKFGSTKNLNEQAKALIEQQKSIWPVAAKNFELLEKIQNRIVDFGHFKIKVQCNPERIRSSAAKTDAKSIAARPCFLCAENMPSEEKGILFQNKYLILTNPYPIFPEHLTISNLEHFPQQILPHFDDMLELSKNLPDFTVFYNGPKCGASAPDHIHFQAGNNGFLPVTNEFEMLENNHSEVIVHDENIKIIVVKNYLRRFISVISSNKLQILEWFEFIYNQLEINSGEEPMMNLLCNYIKGKWRIIIFPRNVQHPSHFFKAEKERIIVGPAAVELGGVLILPRIEDFKKITKTEIAEIYNEVSIEYDKFEKLKVALINAANRNQK